MTSKPRTKPRKKPATADVATSKKGGAPKKAAVRKAMPAAKSNTAKSMASAVAIAKSQADVDEAAAAKAPKPKPKTRQGKRGLVLYVDPKVTVALRKLALDEGKSVQQLGMDALTLLFEQHSVAPEEWCPEN